MTFGVKGEIVASRAVLYTDVYMRRASEPLMEKHRQKTDTGLRQLCMRVTARACAWTTFEKHRMEHIHVPTMLPYLIPIQERVYGF